MNLTHFGLLLDQEFTSEDFTWNTHNLVNFTLNVNTKAMRKKKNISQCVEWMKHFRLHKHQNRPNLLSKLVNFLYELIQKYSTKIFRCEIHFQWKFSPIQSNSPYFSPRKDLMKLLHANFDSFFIYTMIFHRNRRLKKKRSVNICFIQAHIINEYGERKESMRCCVQYLQIAEKIMVFFF